MHNFDTGVKGYVVGECTIKVYFPVSWKDSVDVNCYQCKFFSRNNGLCQITKEISEYPTQFKGSNCPLEFSGEVVKSKQGKED